MSPDESKAVVMALLSIPASEDISVHWTLTPDGTGADTVFQQLNLPYAEAYGLRDLLLEYSGVAFGVLAVGLVLVVNIVVLTVAVRIRTKQKEKALAEKMQSDLDARRAALKLRTMEKLSAVGTLSSMAAHELKQPLTVVNNYAGSLRRRLMRSDVPREVLIDALTEIEESGLKAAEVIDLVRGYATNKERTFVRTDLAMNARHVLDRNRKYQHIIHPDLRLGTYVLADKIELAVKHIHGDHRNFSRQEHGAYRDIEYDLAPLEPNDAYGKRNQRRSYDRTKYGNNGHNDTVYHRGYQIVCL
mgnify:CR=1 FL=1